MGLLDKVHPTTASIQKEYIAKRQRALNAADPVRLAATEAVIRGLMDKYRASGDWTIYLGMIEKWLHESDLTINFDPEKWFDGKTKVDTYMHGYEMALKKKGNKGVMKLPADMAGQGTRERAVVDDLVSLPDEWAHAHPHTQRRRLYDAMSVTGAQTAAYVNAPQLDASVTPTLKGDLDGNQWGFGSKSFESTNPTLYPKVKQVYAALNYRRAPHGAAPTYGNSFLILKPALKANAFYYPVDTMRVALLLGNRQLNRGTDMQTPYQTIGTLVRWGLAEELWQSGVMKKRLGDSSSMGDLLEAHLYKRIRMDRHVEKLVLCKTGPKGLLPYKDWATVHANAMKWCKRHGVKCEIIH